MPFTEQSIKAYPIPEAEQTITPDDCILYSLSVGLGEDPMDARQLRYVYEDGLDDPANSGLAELVDYESRWVSRRKMIASMAEIRVLSGV